MANGQAYPAILIDENGDELDTPSAANPPAGIQFTDADVQPSYHGIETPTLAEVLAAGANANSVNITGLAAMTATNNLALAGGGDAGAVDVSGAPATSAATAGGAASLSGGGGNTTGGGGPISLTGGGAPGAGAGGNVALTGGLSDSGTGGNVVLTGGDSTSGADGTIQAASPLLQLQAAAPADALLAASQFTMWLDATNGAAVLHIKAKQANGTVVGAAIPLT